jgi:SAM-dependent methyltransferase
MTDTAYPRRFALEHAHYTEDLEFWVANAARLGGRVLDLGCATGRVAIALAEAGATVTAVDASSEMVAELSLRLEDFPADVVARVRPVVGDMRRPGEVGGPFDLVILAMNTLQMLLTIVDQLECLRSAAARLRPGGEVIFDVGMADLGYIRDMIGVEQPTGEHRDDARGVTLVHRAWYEHLDPVTQTLTFALANQERADDGEVTEYVRRFTVHLYAPSEIHHLAERAGLRVLAVHGDFDSSPVDIQSERHIYRLGTAA